MFAVQRQTARSWERRSGKRSPERAHASAPPMPAVQRAGCACGGGCPRCRERYPLQAKLEVSQPGDTLEQEADRVAETVLSMPQLLAQGEPSGRTLNPVVQTRYSGEASVAKAPPIVHEVLSSAGQPLDPAVRGFMESRFGHDFSTVQVHTGQLAARSAEAVAAQAYTVGSDVVLGSGRYAPASRDGLRLLAHELTHVVQQAAGANPAVQRQADRSARSDNRATNYRRIHMRFNGDALIVYGDGTELFRYGASSGRPIEISEEHARECGGDARVDTYMSPRFAGIRNLGPIPEGEFRFSPGQAQEFSTGEQLGLLWGGITGRDRVTVQGRTMHAGDWGAGRVALNPVRIEDAPCGSPRARSAFFLHGGLLAGSSGCIDIGTSFDELAEFLQGYRQSISVEVSYETETPRVGFLTGLGGALAYQGFHFRHGPTLRLGAEFGPEPTHFVASSEYQAVLDWAGGALTAGLHIDVPMNSHEAFIRAGLRGGAEFRVLHALYGQLSAGGFIESAGSGSGLGYALGGGLRYDFGPAQLGVLYNVLRSDPQLERHQLLVEVGLRW